MNRDVTSLSSVESLEADLGRIGPRLDRPPDWRLVGAILAVVVGGLCFAAYGVFRDVEAARAPVDAYAPYLLLGTALLIALGFEFVNGFHDTANAVATVIIRARFRQNWPSSGPGFSISSAFSCPRPPSLSASFRCFRSS